MSSSQASHWGKALGQTALLGQGQVRHSRVRPQEHAFDYPCGFVLLPMRSMGDQGVPGLARKRFAPLSFLDTDHGLGGSDACAWMDGVLAQEGVDDAAGELWLMTFPRLWGHAFKPVSFWFAHRADGRLRAIVAEVNNTFGERHCYVLAPEGLDWGQTLRTNKVFHVSPFCAVQGEYLFRFMRTKQADGSERLVARIEHHDQDGLLLRTSISGHLSALNPSKARALAWQTPGLVLSVLWRIHVQAWALWRKKVPFFSKPKLPAHFVSR